MKAFVVNSRDLFDRKKNPKMSLSVSDTMRNPGIEKQCVTCGEVLTYCTIYESGKEKENLFCSKCGT